MGVGLAFLDVQIVPIAAAIVFTTFVMAGRVLGIEAGKGAEIAGGLILIGIGTTILLEHLGVT